MATGVAARLAVLLAAVVGVGSSKGSGVAGCGEVAAEGGVEDRRRKGTKDAAEEGREVVVVALWSLVLKLVLAAVEVIVGDDAR